MVNFSNWFSKLSNVTSGSKMNWFDDVDFAWLASDIDSKLAIVYSPYENLPKKYIKEYSFENYCEMTEYLIDSLESVGQSECTKTWAKSDSEKGFFVYSIDGNIGDAVCFGVPANSRMKSELPKFENLIVPFKNLRFNGFSNVDLRISKY